MDILRCPKSTSKAECESRKTEIQLMEFMRKNRLIIKPKLDISATTQPDNYADEAKTNRNETQTKMTDTRNGAS